MHSSGSEAGGLAHFSCGQASKLVVRLESERIADLARVPPRTTPWSPDRPLAPARWAGASRSRWR